MRTVIWEHCSAKGHRLGAHSLGFLPRTTEDKQETLASQLCLSSCVYIAPPTLPGIHKRLPDAPWSSVYNRRINYYSVKANQASIYGCVIIIRLHGRNYAVMLSQTHQESHCMLTIWCSGKMGYKFCRKPNPSCGPFANFYWLCTQAPDREHLR